MSKNKNGIILNNGYGSLPLLEKPIIISCEAPRGMEPSVNIEEEALMNKQYFNFLSCMEKFLSEYHLIVAEFEKVSYEEFYKHYKNAFIRTMAARVQQSGETVVVYSEEEIHTIARSAYDRIELPTRSTKGSLGYDFHFPFDTTTISHGVSYVVPTGIKAKINYPGWGLFVFPRSSYGFKHQLKIDNTIPVIDADYYGNSDNEGHIMISMTNQSNDGHDFTIDFNDKFCQGVFLPIGYAEEKEVTGERSGGIGSTGK